jgi:small subunit ribosomal protein S19
VEGESVGRSSKKGPNVQRKLLRRVLQQKETGSREPLKTWARDCTIIPEFVGHNFNVHNGKAFLKVFVVEEMVGHRLGEFALTRVFRQHGGASSRVAAEAAAAQGG